MDDPPPSQKINQARMSCVRVIEYIDHVISSRGFQDGDKKWH